MKKKDAKFLTEDVAECAVFVALMVAGANVSIPFFPVPLTFQTVICVLSGLLLGWKKGAISMAVYCFMGLIGLPVFANFGGGVAYVLRPTFGYVIGFIVSAAVAGAIGGKRGLPAWRYIVAALAGMLVNYAVGIPYFCLIWQFYLRSPMLGKYVVEYNLLYMPKDVAMCLMAAIIARGVLPYIGKRCKKNKNTDNETA